MNRISTNHKPRRLNRLVYAAVLVSLVLVSGELFGPFWRDSDKYW
jgi:hypothetical protein